MANLLITGGTGLIGGALVEHFAAQGNQVTVISRSPQAQQSGRSNVRYMRWPEEMTAASSQFGDIDIVINLAGDPINKGRWSDSKKQSILQSRVNITRKTVECIRQLAVKPKLLINASAIGYYGFSDERVFTEADLVEPHNFLTEVSDVWEREAREAEKLGVRVVLARFGIVLSSRGGALVPMVLPYRLFGGGTVASGKQWLSWIHIADVVGLMQHIVDHAEMSGPVNFTAPTPMQMKPFGEAIGRVLRRPHWMPVPTFALRLLFGEMGDLLIKGQRVLPQAAQKHGYKFHFADVDSALRDLLT